MNINRGFAALASVLVISAVFVAVVTTVALLSVGEAQSSFAIISGEQNLQLTEGCVEDVLQRIHDFVLYSATTITRPEGTCQITYNLNGPIDWDVTVLSGSENYSRSIRVVFTRGTTVEITSWQEI